MRMHRTFDQLSPGIKARLESLKQLLATDNNYGRYRDRLATSPPPTLPYIGIFFTDLTFISDGNPATINGLVNFSKCDLVCVSWSLLSSAPGENSLPRSCSISLM
jgi:RasGEF domain